MRTRLGTLGFAMVCAAHANIAHAQSSEAAAQIITPGESHARTLFLDGLDALERGDSARALELLRHSYAIHAVPIVMLNIAQAYRTEGRVIEAIGAFREYLHAGAHTISHERAATVQQTIDYLVAQTATAIVTSTPPRAMVRVDGRELGTAPLAEPLRLQAGEHEFDVELPGYVVVREHVTLVRGDTRVLNFRLAGLRTAGSLAVRVGNSPAPQGVHVAFDGVDVGTPPLERQLDQGGHQVTVAAPGFDTFRAEVILGVRQRREMAVRLDRTRSLAQQPWLWTTVGLIVAGAAAGIVLGLTLGHDPDMPHTTVIVPPGQ